jgi:hypothetical protein
MRCRVVHVGVQVDGLAFGVRVVAFAQSGAQGPPQRHGIHAVGSERVLKTANSAAVARRTDSSAITSLSMVSSVNYSPRVMASTKCSGSMNS